MEKSAHPAALATRLNNLEQKFEEENSLDVEEILAIIAKLFQLTLYGTEKYTGIGLSDDWYKNPNLFDGDFSLAMAVFGPGLENFQIYNAQKTFSFYNRVFGWRIDFDRSLTDTIFGNDTNFSYFQDEGSLFDKIFGYSNTIDAYLSEISGTTTQANFLSAVQLFRKEFDMYKANVEDRLANLFLRVAILESQI